MESKQLIVEALRFYTEQFPGDIYAKEVYGNMKQGDVIVVGGLREETDNALLDVFSNIDVRNVREIRQCTRVADRLIRSEENIYKVVEKKIAEHLKMIESISKGMR